MNAVIVKILVVLFFITFITHMSKNVDKKKNTHTPTHKRAKRPLNNNQTLAQADETKKNDLRLLHRTRCNKITYTIWLCEKFFFTSKRKTRREEPLYLGSEISVEYPKEASKGKNWREDKQEIRSKIVRKSEVNTIFLRHD